MNKKELRIKIKNKVSCLTQEYIYVSSEKIQKTVISSSCFKNASSIFIYVSTACEPGTSLIIKTALKEDKRVYVPKCIAKGVMIPVRIDKESVLKPGFMNIPEPEEAMQENDVRIDLAVIPCVSADLKGNRLGHGGGFYDIFLEKTDAEKVCLCFSELLCDKIPTEKHDIKMDKVITENSGAF